jgi:hypothetical protein
MAFDWFFNKQYLKYDAYYYEFEGYKEGKTGGYVFVEETSCQAA